MSTYDSLKVLKEVLYRSFYKAADKVLYDQLVLPRELRVPFLAVVHNNIAGHLKQTKCIPHVMRRAWWFGWKADLNLFIKCCTKCESCHRGKSPKQANLHATHSGQPGEKLAIEIVLPISG